MNTHMERPFRVTIDKQNGHFAISIFHKAMLGSRLTARIGKKEALLERVQSLMAIDELGPHERWEMTYVSKTKEKRKFTAIMKIYEGFTSFEAVNLFAIKGKQNKHLYGHPYISFPCFEGDQWDKTCSCLSFKRQAPFNHPVQWEGSVVDSFRDGKNVPLMITNASYETVLLSPLNHLLYGTVSIHHLKKRVQCGIPRAVHIIPKKTSMKTIMVYGVGVNRTLEKWGNLLQNYYGVGQVDQDADVLLKYLSYWTNAGSAYWYNSHRKLSYEETFKKLKKHHDEIGINFGSYQLDSWWYKKEGDEYTSGITEWEPKMLTRSKNFNSMLPFMQRYKDLGLFKNDKLSYVQDLLDTPIGCHFKQLANDSIYVKEAKEDYIIEDFPMPKNKKVAKELFRSVFNHPKWELSYVVHDWLQYMNDKHSVFRDIKLGPMYFKALDKVLNEVEAPMNRSGHLSLQLCMTQPHMTLNSVTMPSVTSIRSTSDSDSFFVEGTKRWWWHLYSSKFIQVLGKYAFYDNRKTKKNHMHPFSSYSKFEMIMLALSCGPIGLGDKIGEENIALIRRVIKENGEIIKPDIPSTPLDRCYLRNPHKASSSEGVTVYTYTDLEVRQSIGDVNNYKVLYLLTFNAHPYGKKVRSGFSLLEAEGEKNRNYAIYDYVSGDIDIVSSDYENSFEMKRRKFFYYVCAPIYYGFAVIGDVTKHVSASKQIIKEIRIDKNSLTLVLGYENKINDSTYVIYSERKPYLVIYDGYEQQFTWKDQLLTIVLKHYDKEGNVVNTVKEPRPIKKDSSRHGILRKPEHMVEIKGHEDNDIHILEIIV